MSSMVPDNVLTYLDMTAQEKDGAHAAMTVPQRQEMTAFMKTMHATLQSICADEFAKLEVGMEK